MRIEYANLPKPFIGRQYKETPVSLTSKDGISGEGILFQSYGFPLTVGAKIEFQEGNPEDWGIKKYARLDANGKETQRGGMVLIPVKIDGNVNYISASALTRRNQEDQSWWSPFDEEMGKYPTLYERLLALAGKTVTVKAVNTYKGYLFDNATGQYARKDGQLVDDGRTHKRAVVEFVSA